MSARPRQVALLGMGRGGAPGGGAVVLDVAQLEALLTGTFSIGLDVGRGREKVALVRLRLSRALPGAAGTQAMAAEALAIEQGVATEQIAAAGGLALHAAACTGMPDPVLHLAARAMGVVTGLAALEPDPRAPGADVLLATARQAATGLPQLLAFRHDCTTVTIPAEQAAATAGLTSAAAELGKAAEALHPLALLTCWSSSNLSPCPLVSVGDAAQRSSRGERQGCVHLGFCRDACLTRQRPALYPVQRAQKSLSLAVVLGSCHVPASVPGASDQVPPDCRSASPLPPGRRGPQLRSPSIRPEASGRA